MSYKPPYTADEYRNSLLHLYPQGEIWDAVHEDRQNEYSIVIDALVARIMELEGNIDTVLQETHVNTVSTLPYIECFEKSLGIDNTGLPIPERKARLQLSYQPLNGITALFERIARSNNYTLVAIQNPVSYTHLTLPTICSV